MASPIIHFAVVDDWSLRVVDDFPVVDMERGDWFHNVVVMVERDRSATLRDC